MEQPIVETLSPRLEPAFQVLGARSHHSLAVAFHPTANFLVSAGEDGTIRVWDWHAGVLQRTLLGHTKAVSGIDFDSGGNLLGALCACYGDGEGGALTHSIILSELFLRPDHLDMGHPERLGTHENTPRP